MAGHSKWANIKRRKAVQDSKKAKIFTRLTREIIIAAQQGSEPASNTRLRLAIQHAKDANIPKENILRAIKKGSGAAQDNRDACITYEGYAPHGVAVLIEAITDNKQRTVADLRALFQRYSGNLDKKGAIQHRFWHQGHCMLTQTKLGDDTTMALIEAGVEEMKPLPEGLLLVYPYTSISSVQKALAFHQLHPEKTLVTYVPDTTIELAPPQRDKVARLLTMLAAQEDVQHVYHDLACFAID